MNRTFNLLVRLWMAIVFCFKWLYRIFSKKNSKRELPTYSSEWKDTDKEWEDWETEALTVTVVPNKTPAEPADPRLKYSTRLPSAADNDPSAEELFHDMQPVFKKPKKLKVFRNEEQPVVSVDSRKFAIDSSFQPSTETEELEVWRDDEVSCSWEDDATFDDNELLKVSREALREKRLQEREQRRQQVETAARLKQEQSKLVGVKTVIK